MYSENEPDNDHQSEDEERFVNVAYELKGKYNVMMNNYQMLLMKESMVSQSNSMSCHFLFSTFFASLSS